MKEVRLLFGRGGEVRILADGPNGKGTEKFTEELAKALGTIEERHKGHFHTHVTDQTTVKLAQGG